MKQMGKPQYHSFSRSGALCHWLGFLGLTVTAGVPGGIRVSDHISLGVVA